MSLPLGRGSWYEFFEANDPFSSKTDDGWTDQKFVSTPTETVKSVTLIYVRSKSMTRIVPEINQKSKETGR